MSYAILAFLSVLGFVAVPHAALAATPPADGLAPLKVLVGEWRGTDSEGKTIRATYQFTSAGTSLTETLTHADKPAMTTMYHLDGDRLMLTHYCSLGNQPRMRADAPKGEVKTLTFAFVDATNLVSPSAPHMHKVTFTFQDNDHFAQEWTLSKDGKEMPHTFRFERTK